MTNVLIRMMPERLRDWLVDQLTEEIESLTPDHAHRWTTDSCWGGKHDGPRQGTLGFDRWCKTCRRREHLGV